MIVLMSIGIASFSSAGKSARDAKRKSDLETIRQAMVMYKVQEGEYPIGTFDQIRDELLAKSMLTQPLPADPLDDSDYTTYNIGTTTFCMCDLMEVPNRGNSGANCSFAAKTYYCVAQP